MRGETTEDALIALIADDPRADGPRLVLADYYAERADPRGELMALQLATRRQGGHEARLRMLLATHGSALAGSLADVLLASSLRFERGRLAAGQTRFASAAERCAVRGHPLWATVEELTTDDPELVADPMMRSLRAAHGLGLSAFASVCRGERPLPLEELTVWTSTLDAGSPADRAAIANARCLPRLRHLRW
ncbi:MAG TPA: TIGR02996 domain-containing protein, partial [Kofleriaceae bacterium]|nr:TIGR02996 domain-containing protein [Kofleriaceae bacterium]